MTTIREVTGDPNDFWSEISWSYMTSAEQSLWSQLGWS